MKNVLVTGANGFIGRHLIKKLLDNRIAVTAIVRNDTSMISTKSDNLDVVCCSMEEIDKLESLLKRKNYFDTIYHLAWSGTFGSERADYKRQINNVKYTLDVINAAADLGIKRFIGAGSLAEYDNLCYLSVDGAEANPVAMYGAAKISAHFMSKIECGNRNMEHVWGVFSNIYGIGNETGNFVNFAIKLMLTKKRAAFTSGEQYYDFVYISDFIDGLYLMGEYGKDGHEYFVGSGYPKKLKEYIYCIRDAVDPNIEIYLGEIPYKGISLKPEQLSIKKLQQCGKYNPGMNFENGIKKTVEWFRQDMLKSKLTERCCQ